MANTISRAINAWYDGERDGWAVPLLLVSFVVMWTAYHLSANLTHDVHMDVIEVSIWARHLDFGYAKHPPLAGLIAAAWYSLFPVSDWSSILLAMVNAAVGLFTVYLIARRYLSADKRLLALLLLLLTPFYQFHSVHFSTNQVLLSTWPIATYCFLRAFESRAPVWSAAAGLAAAAAMLGKYYSVFLIAGFAVAAAAHPARWSYLRSSSPWISAGVGLAVLAPHIYWLTTSGYQPFDYAMRLHGGASLGDVAYRIVTYFLGAVGYVALPLAVYFMAVRPSRQALADAFWPADPDRRMLVFLLAVPLVLPALIAPLIGALITSLWTMSAWFLLPIVLLAPESVVLRRTSAVAVASLVAGFTVAALAISPVTAFVKHLEITNYRRTHYKSVAAEMTQLWRQATGRPLTLVSGNLELASAASFYSPDHPDAAPNFDWSFARWMSRDRPAREGWVAVCPEQDAGCLATIAQYEAVADPKPIRHIYQPVVWLFGRPSPPATFVIVLFPPKQ